MCLGVIGRISDVSEDGVVAVDVTGRVVPVNASLIEPAPAVGDWVLVHSGFAVSRLDEQDALDALRLRRRMGAGVQR